jgi:hypothetical protein
MTEALETWTIYDRPLDYPDGYVARRFLIRHGAALATHIAYYGPTLDSVREQIPQGLFCIARNPGDEPQIVETWL